MKELHTKIPQNLQFGAGGLKKLPEMSAESHSDHIYTFVLDFRGLVQISVC